MFRKLLLAGVIATACFAQQFEIGAKGGIPVTSTFETSSFFTIGFGEGASSATRRYTVGPMIGVWLPHGFGVEFDALYSRLGFDDLVKSAGTYLTSTRTTAGSWEFPILGKYRFSRLPAALKPFVDGGASFRHVTGVSSLSDLYFVNYYFLSQTTSNTSAILDARSSRGGVVGVGLETRLGFLRISPEIRYTRWGADRNLDPSLYSNQNQVDVLLGVSFRK